MKKVICVILGLIVVLGAWPLYGVCITKKALIMESSCMKKQQLLKILI